MIQDGSAGELVKVAIAAVVAAVGAVVALFKWFRRKK